MGMKDKFRDQAEQWQQQAKEKAGEAREKAGQRGPQRRQPERGRQDLEDTEQQDMRERFDEDFDR